MADGICLQINWIALPRVQTRSVIPQKTSLKTSTARIPQVCAGPRLQWWRRSTFKQVNNRNYRLSTPSAQSRHGNNNDGNESDDAEGRPSWSPRDDYGLYPWDPSWELPEQNGVDWIQDDVITLFTTDGLVRIGGSIRPSNEIRQSQSRASIRKRRYREEDYMDPKQGLCLGAIFDIAATNGLDRGRRICVFGFCRSIEMLNDVVQDTVLDLGGEVVMAEKGTTEGLHEKLSMTVAMPLLWGVPPAVDTLHYAIRSGGGIVEKTYKQWQFL